MPRQTLIRLIHWNRRLRRATDLYNRLAITRAPGIRAADARRRYYLAQHNARLTKE